ncbi:MAG TPA: SHOCT domain-containing protein [Nitrososphaeraceae archaeon]
MWYIIEIMRGRWASAAIGAGVARRRAGAEMEQQDAAHQREMDQLKADQQRQIDELKQQQQSKPQQSSGQEDVTQKLQKLADLKKQGILSDEEFQKLKMELLAKL